MLLKHLKAKSLPRKWLSMNQTQRANNSIKNDSLDTLYGKYNYEEGPTDQIYESESTRFSIQASSSKALISNTHLQDSDSDVEEDTSSNSEFIADLNAKFHDKALLANQKKILQEDEGVTKVKAFMAIVEDEPFFGKGDAKLGQWVEITMKKVHRLLSMTNDDERKHALDYTHVNLHYVEDLRKNFLSKFNSLNQELLSSKSLSETVLEITSDFESECDNMESLPPFPKLTRVKPSGTSIDVLTFVDSTLTPTIYEKIKKVLDKRFLSTVSDFMSYATTDVTSRVVLTLVRVMVIETTKDFENEFPAIVYNEALTSKSNFSTEPTLCPQHIDEFDLKDETSLSEYDEAEQNILYFNDLLSFNIIYLDDLKSDKGDDDNKIDMIQSSGGSVLLGLVGLSVFALKGGGMGGNGYVKMEKSKAKCTNRARKWNEREKLNPKAYLSLMGQPVPILIG
nr:hypothetical protein [Tanacetum cinerariifolium]